jgi:hypothetical protein
MEVGLEELIEEEEGEDGDAEGLGKETIVLLVKLLEVSEVKNIEADEEREKHELGDEEIASVRFPLVLDDHIQSLLFQEGGILKSQIPHGHHKRVWKRFIFLIDDRHQLVSQCNNKVIHLKLLICFLRPLFSTASKPPLRDYHVILAIYLTEISFNLVYAC